MMCTASNELERSTFSRLTGFLLAAGLGAGCAFDPSGGASAGSDGESSPGSDASTGNEDDAAPDDEDDDDAHTSGPSEPSTTADPGPTSGDEPTATVGSSASEEPGDSTGSDAEVCGDQVVNAAEECDDANTNEVDGCTSSCTVGPKDIEVSRRTQTRDRFGGWRWDQLDVDVSCERDEVLVGFSGVFSDYFGYFVLARVRPVCAPMALANTVPSAVELGADVVGDEIGTYSSPSDTAFDLRCPEGEVVSGIHGRGGEYLDQLGLVCRRPSLAAEQTSIARSDWQYFQGCGSSAGTPQELFCPSGTLASGVRVVGNAYAVGIFLNCSDVSVGFGL